MKPKLLLVVLLSISGFQCKNKSTVPCPLCVDPAFVITMMDSTGNKLGGFTIKARTTSGETLIVNSLNPIWQVDSTYVINGNSGLYHLEISNPQYETINIDSVVVQGGRCGPNARILGIIAREPRLSKKLNATYIIAFDSSGVGCGN